MFTRWQDRERLSGVQLRHNYSCDLAPKATRVMAKGDNMAWSWRGAGVATTVTLVCALVVGATPAAQASPPSDTGSIGLSIRVINQAPAAEVYIPSGVQADTADFVVKLSGLEPLTYIEIWVHSTPILIYAGYTSATGTVEVTLNMPDNLPVGTHAIVVEATAEGGAVYNQPVQEFIVVPSIDPVTGEQTTNISVPSQPTDGSLSLVAPSGATTTFGAPTLIDNTSVSVGTLPSVKVVDNRQVSKPGWSIEADVRDFVLATDASVTIPKTNVGLLSEVDPTLTDATGVVPATEQVAGRATYPAPYVLAPAGSGVGTSVVGGHIVLVAPQEKPAGTYTSTLSLTLKSN
jgi:hypothetical protein